MEKSPGTGRAMYGFLACTAGQFVTRPVVTVKRHTAMRELGPTSMPFQWWKTERCWGL